MWEAELPDVEEPLRQGDLLVQVPLAVHQRGEPSTTTEVTLSVEVRDVLVVGQCCTIQNKGIVGLAPIRSMREAGQRQEFVDGLRRKPPVERGVNLPVNFYLLDPHSSIAGAGNRLKVVELLSTKIVHIGDDPTWLQRRRSARMTPVGRRDLRSRVNLHWARPTEDDAAALLLEDEPLLLPAYLPDEA